MKLIIEENINTITEVKEPTTILELADFDVGQGKIPDTIIDAKGDIIVGTAADSYEKLAIGTDGYILTADSTQSGGISWAAAAGGGGGLITLTNKSGSSVSQGDVVIGDPDNDESFVTTDLERDRRVIGVATESISNNAEGSIAVGGSLETVNVNGNVSRGQWLISYAGTGYAKADGYHRPPGAIGIALTAYAGGGTGTVTALILPDFYSIYDGGINYMFGGADSVGITSTIMKFVRATETASTNTGTLSVARRSAVSLWSVEVSTHSYPMMGNASGFTSSAEKFTNATEVSTSIGNTVYNNETAGGCGDGTYGYNMGGEDGGDKAEVGKTAFSTDTHSASTALTYVSARGGSFQSSTKGYCFHGHIGWALSNVHSLVKATGVTAAAGNFSYTDWDVVGVNSNTHGASYSGENPGTNTGLLAFATETKSISSGSPAVKKDQCGGGSFANAGVGYMYGSHTTSDDIHKHVFATDLASVIASVLPKGITQQGQAVSTV